MKDVLCGKYFLSKSKIEMKLKNMNLLHVNIMLARLNRNLPNCDI